MRLLAQARAALGKRSAACEAAERALSEAAAARYVWLEMLSLCDLLGWCEASEADAARSRLAAVKERVAASEQELAGVGGTP